MKFLSCNLLAIFSLLLISSSLAQEAMQKGQILPSGALTTNAPVTAVAFSPNSSILAAGMTGRIALWNATTGEAMPELTGFNATVTSMVFSPHSNILASGSLWGDGQVQVWNLANANIILTLNHGAPITTLAFSPNGRSLASAGTDKIIKIWNLQGDLNTQFSGLQHAPTALQWIPGTNFLQSAGGGVARAATGDAAVETQGEYAEWSFGDDGIRTHVLIPGGSQFCAFSSDGTRVAMAGTSARATKKDGVDTVEWSNDHLVLWRIGAAAQAAAIQQPLKIPHKISSTGLKSLAWSNNGGLLAWSTPGHVSTLMLADTGAAPAVLQPNKKDGGTDPAINGFGCVAFSPDGRFLIAGDANPATDAAHGVQIWGIVE